MEQTIAAVVMAAWVVEAVALGSAMGRRGFDRGAWTVIALGIGPLSLPMAFSTLRKPGASEPALAHAARSGDGAVDVLVGIDGSPESAAAVAHARSLLGARLGRLTLAQVIPIDAGPDAEAAAQRLVAAAADNAEDATCIVLRGRPVDRLRHYAEGLGYELLAVGSRGAGRTYSLVGSVAFGLSQGSGVPVLLVDADDVALAGAPQHHAVAR